MIVPMYNISSHDSVNAPYVLREDNSAGKLAVMEEYQDLVCKKCRKVDEKAALSRGIQKRIVVISKRPFLLSLDMFYLLDERSKHVFSSILPEEIDYYQIPSSSFFVACAKTWVQPELNDPGFRFGKDRCKECGRYREVVWGKVPPTLPLRPFVSVNLEGIKGAREAWLVSQEIAKELEKVSPPLTGMAIIPKQVNDACAVQ